MKLYRKFLALCLTAALAAGMVITASADVPSVKVLVNGQTVSTSAYINSDWRTMVPVEVADAMGITYTVNGDSVTFTAGGITQTYTAGAAAGDTVAVKKDGTLYVPFYHLGQTFGFRVSWDSATGGASAAGAVAGNSGTSSHNAISLDGYDVASIQMSSEPNRLPLTGYFDKIISYTGNNTTQNRSAKLYIADGSPMATYVTVIAVPDGVDTWQFLSSSGWIAYADQQREALYILEPGQNGWGGSAEEKSYVDAAMTWLLAPKVNDTAVLSTYGIFYFAGYGQQSAALETWCAAHPLQTIAQAYVDSTGAPADELNSIGQTKAVEAGRTDMVIEDEIKMTYAEITIPIWYATQNASQIGSLSYWKQANDVLAAPEMRNGTAVYHQKQDSDRWMTTLWNNIFAEDPDTYGPYGLSEVAVKSYSGTPDYAAFTSEMTAFLSRYLSYDTSTEYNKQLSVRADWNELGVKTVVTEIEAVKGNTKREYLVYAPEGYEKPYGGVGAPLVLVEAGAGTTDKNFFNASQWWQVAQKNNFVLVFLCEDNNTPTTLTYHDFDIFMDKVVEEVTAAYQIDESRIYLNGHSAGSGSTQAVGVLYPQEYAAIATTSAIPNMNDVPSSFCGMFGGAGRSYSGPSNEKIPVFFMYGEGDRPELHDGIWHSNHKDSPYYSEIDTTIEDLTKYHLNIWGLSMGKEGTATCDEYTYETTIPQDAQHGYESWIWSVKANGTAIPVYRVSRMQNIGHTNSNTEFDILWNFMKHYRVAEDGTRYYSASAFEQNDAVKIP